MQISQLLPKSQTTGGTRKSHTPSPRLLFNKHYLPLRTTSPHRSQQQRHPAALLLPSIPAKLVDRGGNKPARVHTLISVDFTHPRSSDPQRRSTPAKQSRARYRQHRPVPIVPFIVADEAPSKPPSPWKRPTNEGPMSPQIINLL